MIQRKKWGSFFFIAILLITLFTVFFGGASAAEQKILVVSKTQEDGQQLQALLSACRQPSDLVLERDYQKDKLSGYQGMVSSSRVPLEEARAKGIKRLLTGEAAAFADGVVTEEIKNASISMELRGYSELPRFQQEVTVLASGSGNSFGELILEQGRYPFAVKGESEACAPYFQPQSLSAIAMGELMQNFFGFSGGKMYLLLDEIYAFSDAYLICRTAEVLYENGMPFIIRVIPLYDNLDYPAFLRFAQVLRYVQAHNGTVVIHEPLVSPNEHVREPLEDKMKRFIQALEKENIAYQPMDVVPYSLSLDALEQIQSSGKNFGTFSMDTMIPLSLVSTEEELKSTVEKLQNKWLSLEDYKRNFTNQSYSYRETAIDEQYQYVQEEEQFFTGQMQRGNNVLIVVVVAGLLTLIVLLLIGSRVYRKKFYH